MADERRRYDVTLLEQEGGPDPELRTRLAQVLAFRLASLEANEGSYPAPGDAVDMLDNFEGKFLWEMSDEELDRHPPTRVDFEIVSVDPIERPATLDVPVAITANIPF